MKFNQPAADFNVSAMIGRNKSTKLTQVEGTMYFYAPEMCEDRMYEEEFEGFPLDVWALGVTTFALVYMKLPFSGSKNNYYDLFSNIMTKDVEFPQFPQISLEFKELISSMLIKDPKNRITCAGLQANKWLFDEIYESRRQSFHENIKITEEDIEKSLDFFIAKAKNRNYELIWKPRMKRILTSNNLKNVSSLRSSNSKSSDKSLNSKHSPANDLNISLGRFNSSQEHVETYYFRSRKSSELLKQVNEDDFFDN